MGPQPLGPEAPAPGSRTFDSCRDPGGRGPSARPPPGSAALPAALPAELNLGSVAIGWDAAEGKSVVFEPLLCLQCRRRRGERGPRPPASLPLSPCTCPAVPQPWPTAASRSPATCSAARAGAPRGCTASRPSWGLPRTTRSSALSQRSQAPGAPRSETRGRARGPLAQRRPRGAPRPAHHPPRSTKVSAVSARPGCCEAQEAPT